MPYLAYGNVYIRNYFGSPNQKFQFHGRIRSPYFNKCITRYANAGDTDPIFTRTCDGSYEQHFITSLFE